MQMILPYLAAHTGLLAAAAFLFFSFARLKTYLHIFQQEEYDGRRFLTWMVATGSVDRTATSATLAIFVLALLLPRSVAAMPSALAGAVLVLIAERDRRHQGSAKKPLVMTSRATRTFRLAWTVLNAAALAVTASFDSPAVWPIAIQLCPLMLVAANLVLLPFEEAVRRRYWREAHEKLLKLAPYVVGITGSFGKTSTKHILGHLLQYHSSTLITPGSVNTPMGISRVIREQLRSSHRFFVVEMGAYGPGSIAALCDLVQPKLGILTAVGAAHLERFRSIDTTARAKMELATAVVENGGKMVLNAAVATLGPVAEQLAAKRSSFVTCGNDAADIVFSNVSQSPAGIAFDLSCEGSTVRIETPLFGRHHAQNVALAFAAARELGMPIGDIQRALRSVPQITHRLEVKRQGNGSLIIDDAYNSNPEGFESALELLGALKGEGGGAYLITPGMVELGSKHASEHFRLGELAARTADFVYLVAADRIPTFAEGVRSVVGSDCKLEKFPTFEQAYAKVLAQLAKGDVVLLENDLPDLYERKMRL